MVKTIGNPLSWAVQAVGATGSAVAEGVGSVGGEAPPPVLRDIGVTDIREALRKGWQDMLALRSDVFLVVAIYPVAGLCIAALASNMATLPLLFPALAGFALIGPLAAVGLYEMSRRRAAGLDTGWRDAFAVWASPARAPMMVLGLALLALFALWIGAAALLYEVTLGPEPPASLGAFVDDVFGTAAGWTMIMLGAAIGIGFAVAVLAISVISFPLLLDRNVGLAVAVVTSARMLRTNPHATLTWGAIVAGLLGLGMLPALLGLIVVMPVLGHATWHVYCAAVEDDPTR